MGPWPGRRLSPEGLPVDRGQWRCQIVAAHVLDSMEAESYTVYMYSILAQNAPEQLSSAPLTLPEVGSARAGFPSPAEDLQEKAIDLVDVLVSHPQATFLIRARGNSMEGAGIHDNALLVVDRALKAQHMDIVVAVVDGGEFTIKYLHKRGGRPKLKAANPTFPDITPKDGQTLEIWGVVTAGINQYRK